MTTGFTSLAIRHYLYLVAPRRWPTGGATVGARLTSSSAGASPTEARILTRGSPLGPSDRPTAKKEPGEPRMRPDCPSSGRRPRSASRWPGWPASTRRSGSSRTCSTSTIVARSVCNSHRQSQVPLRTASRRLGMRRAASPSRAASHFDALASRERRASDLRCRGSRVRSPRTAGPSPALGREVAESHRPGVSLREQSPRIPSTAPNTYEVDL